MTYTKTYEVKNNSQLIIQLPDHFKTKRKVRVTIEDVEDEQDNKIELMMKAANDPQYLADIDEISRDFEIIDNEPDE
jgi:hypothetical protein